MSTEVSGTSREEVAREAATNCVNSIKGVRPTDQYVAADRRALEKCVANALLAFSDRERAPVRVDVERMREALTNLSTKEHGVGMSYQRDSLDGPALRLYGKRAEAAYWLLSNGHSIAAALTPTLQTGGEGKGRDVEAAAWAWLEKRFGTASDDPVDRAYAADEMVDAFHAGRGSTLSPAPSALSVPEGWVAVPRVPTRAMLDAGKAAGFWDDPEMTFAANVWTDMIRAAMEE